MTSLEHWLVFIVADKHRSQSLISPSDAVSLRWQKKLLADYGSTADFVDGEGSNEIPFLCWLNMSELRGPYDSMQIDAPVQRRGYP